MNRLRTFVIALLCVAPLGLIVPMTSAHAFTELGDAQSVPASGAQKFGGRMIAVAVDPRNGGHVFAAGESGGLWERANDLASWTLLSGFNGLPRFQLSDVAIDPGGSGTLIVTTPDDGVANQSGSGVWVRQPAWFSGWHQISLPTQVPCAARMGAGGIEFKGHLVAIAQTCGVLLSGDSGHTWTLSTPPGLPVPNFTDVAISASGVNFAACGRVNGLLDLWTANPFSWSHSALPNVFGPVQGINRPALPSNAPPTGYRPMIGLCSLAFSPTANDDLLLTGIDSTGYSHLLESDAGGRSGWIDISPFTTLGRPPFVTMSTSPVAGRPYLYWGDGKDVFRQRCTSDATRPDCLAGPESGLQCTDAPIQVAGVTVTVGVGRDDDGDGVVNEGCPPILRGENPESNSCRNNTDDDADLRVNDGCFAIERLDVGGHPDSSDVGLVTVTSFLGPEVCPKFIANDGGIKTSRDCGRNYLDDNRGMNALQVYQVAGSNTTLGASGLHLAMGTQDNGLYLTANAGASWTNPISADIPDVLIDSLTTPYRTLWTQCVDCHTRTHTGDAALAGSTQFLFPGGGDTPLINDGLTTWGRDKWATFGPGTGMNTFRLYVSTSATSISWNPVGPDIPKATAPRSLRVAVSQGVPTFFFALDKTANPLRSITGTSATATLANASGTDPDAEHRLVTPVQTCAGDIGGFRCPDVYAVDPNNPRHLFAADAFDSTIKESINGGASWDIDQGATSQVTAFGLYNFEPTAMAVDPRNASTVTIGNARTGLVASTDGGISWGTVANTFLNAPFITDFFFDYYGHQLWFTTFGRGIWKVPAPDVILE